MGRFCAICGRVRPNEQFSWGRRVRAVCKPCKRLPKADRDWILAREEIRGFMRQSRISKKNVARLQILAASKDERIRGEAELVAAIAQVAPGRRNRFRHVCRENPDLYADLIVKGCVSPWVLDVAESDYDDAFNEALEAGFIPMGYDVLYGLVYAMSPARLQAIKE